MFFLQMSGFPGSGKSTLSGLLAKSTKAIVIDHDVVKTALLESIENDLNPKRVGGISYDIEWSLVDFYLSQGHDVIHDSPCLYDEMINRGTALTEKHGAKYKYVECFLDDVNEINDRLKNRIRMPSQIDEVTSEEGFKKTINNSKKPSGVKCIRVDTSQPISDYIHEVIAYLAE
ncbi:AAA family ATPase [Ferroacidibacillus organovorans]|uniref:ATP-binding protein n=1 Tax=Ferroacidibacillus organovorans TaxID=1765683 RepID=A0A853K8K5_9BACL|nr:AAA family ATPase [Ferroacidibacillus organovorans]KYP79260.1 ATP-binding protein [Ferroacidibacillus organovorans]OAG87903.1 ATP-binding protein [Ferroacidibacillus organovorans]